MTNNIETKINNKNNGEIVMKTQKEILTDKLRDWCDNQSDYLMKTTQNYSDFGDPNEEILLVFKKRKKPLTKNSVKVNGEWVSVVQGNVSDTHYLILQVHPIRKTYNVTDRRMFSNHKTMGLTFDELIT